MANVLLPIKTPLLFFIFIYLFHVMGRKKLTMRRIESPTTRQAMYAKRKDGIIKKADELSILCDTDVALVMFSPSSRLTSFATNGSKVEDVFLRFLDKPDELRGGPIENEQFLTKRLKQLKHEREMVEKIATIEKLEEKLEKLNRRGRELQEKLGLATARHYDPNLEKINSVLEAGVYQQFLTSSVLSKETTVQIEDAASVTDQHSVDGNHYEDEFSDG